MVQNWSHALGATGGGVNRVMGDGGPESGY